MTYEEAMTIETNRPCAMCGGRGSIPTPRHLQFTGRPRQACAPCNGTGRIILEDSQTLIAIIAILRATLIVQETPAGVQNPSGQ